MRQNFCVRGARKYFQGDGYRRSVQIAEINWWRFLLFDVGAPARRKTPVPSATAPELNLPRYVSNDTDTGDGIPLINADAQGRLDFFDRRLQCAGIDQCMVLSRIGDEILYEGFREECLCFF